MQALRASIVLALPLRQVERSGREARELVQTVRTDGGYVQPPVYVYARLTYKRSRAVRSQGCGDHLLVTEAPSVSLMSNARDCVRVGSRLDRESGKVQVGVRTKDGQIFDSDSPARAAENAPNLKHY